MSLMAPFSAISHRASSAARSAVQSLLLYAIIGALALVGIGFLIAAFYIWLASATDPLAAALLVGVSFLAVSGITLAIVIAHTNKRKRERRQSATDTALMASTVSLASTGLRIASRARGHLFWPAIAAIAAGWYLSQSGGDDED